nr:unnamed protein product [Haemonchus contortus]
MGVSPAGQDPATALDGKEPEMATMVELKQAMEQQFQPKKLLMAERFGLMSKSQKAGQTLQEYYAEVQKAAGTCGFEKIKDMRDAMVAMVFIGGSSSASRKASWLAFSPRPPQATQ